MIDDPAFELFKTLLIVFPLWLTAVQIIFRQHREYNDIHAISPEGFQKYLIASLVLFPSLILVLYLKFTVDFDWVLQLILGAIVLWIVYTLGMVGMTILDVSFIEDFKGSKSSEETTSQTEIYDFSEEPSE